MPTSSRLAPSAAPDLIHARVALVTGDALQVQAADGPRAAFITGRLRHDAASPADLPTVGDHVELDPETGVVRSVLPRYSAIIRSAPGRASVAQVLAANVDLVLVVASLNRDFALPRLQRMLAIAAAAPAPAVVLLSKSDLVADPASEVARVRAALADAAPVLAFSVRDGTGMDAVEALLPAGETAVLLGSSGVGKTTLLNRLTGEEPRATGAIRARDDRGRHTTTHRELVALTTGAFVIDTPGLRNVEVFDAPEQGGPFADIDELARGCRFRNCRHNGEPGCAVVAAIAGGHLDADRVEAREEMYRQRDR